MGRILEVAVPRVETKIGHLLLPCLLSLCALTSSLRAQTVATQVPVGNLPLAIAVNPVTNKIYVANSGSDNLTIIDGATGNPTFLGVGAGPSAIAINTATNKIYVADSGGVEVDVIDGATNAITPLVVGEQPKALAVNPVTNKIYVANSESNNLTIIDGATNATTTIATGTTPRAVAVNTVTNQIYVANWSSNDVTVIDGATGTTSTIAVGTNPDAVAVNPATDQIYVANEGSSNVTDIQGATGATTTIFAGTNPCSVTVNPVSNKIYVANYESANVTVIDGASNIPTAVFARINPSSIAIDTLTNQIYVASQSSSNLTVIDGATNASSVVALGGNTLAVAVNPVTNKVYAANQGTNSFGSNNVAIIDESVYDVSTLSFSAPSPLVTQYPETAALNPITNKLYVAVGPVVLVIDAVTFNLVDVIKAGPAPAAIAVNPVTNRIYVVNDAGVNGSVNGSVSVIDGNDDSLISTVSLGPSFICGGSCLAVNPAINKTYVSNDTSPGGVTVIDGSTNDATFLPIGPASDFAINQATNKIYVEMDSASLSVIDGATNNTATIVLPDHAKGIAINPVTDKIYVAGLTTGIYVVDGSTNTITAEITGIVQSGVMVNPVTNKIYAFGLDPDNSNTLLAAIDGVTNNIYPVQGISASSPGSVQVDPVRNKIYAWGSGGVYVVDGATDSVSNIITDSTFSMTAGTFSGLPVLNPVNGNVYKDELSLGSADVASLQPAAPNPLVATINPLTGNATSNPSPTFTFTASSSFAPIAPPVQNVYYQLDTTQGTWLPATGTAPSFSATLSSVPLGSHVLFYYATDGSDSTSVAVGSTSIGTVSAYPFTVVNP